jgi:hypothetical protein
MWALATENRLFGVENVPQTYGLGRRDLSV